MADEDISSTDLEEVLQSLETYRRAEIARQARLDRFAQALTKFIESVAPVDYKVEHLGSTTSEKNSSVEDDRIVLCQPLDTAIQQTLDVVKTKGDLHDELMNLSESQDVSSFTEGNQTLAKPQPGLPVKLADASSMPKKMDEKKIFNNDVIYSLSDLRGFKGVWNRLPKTLITQSTSVVDPPLHKPPDWTYGAVENPPPPPAPPDRSGCEVASAIGTTDISVEWATYAGLRLDLLPKLMGHSKPKSITGWAFKNWGSSLLINQPRGLLLNSLALEFLFFLKGAAAVMDTKTQFKFEVRWDPTMPPPPLEPPDTGHSAVISDTPGSCDAGVMILLQLAEASGYLLPLADSWRGNAFCHGWRFIVCSGEKIVQVNFAKQGLQGTISFVLANLTDFRSLCLNGKKLTGLIPESLTTLSQIVTFDVSDNNLSEAVSSFSSKVKFVPVRSAPGGSLAASKHGISLTLVRMASIVIIAGIEYNMLNGGPIPEEFTYKVYQCTTHIKEHLIAQDLLDVDITTIVVTNFTDPEGPIAVEVFDSRRYHILLMKSIFDFQSVRKLLSSPKFILCYDTLHGVNGIVYVLVWGIEKFGGQISLQSHLVNHIVKKDKEIGVKLQRGQYIWAKRTIVSNATMWNTFKLVLPEVVQMYYSEGSNMILPCESFIQFQLVLDAEGKCSELRIHHIVVNNYKREVDAYQRFVLLSVPSVLSPNLATLGKQTVEKMQDVVSITYDSVIIEGVSLIVTIMERLAGKIALLVTHQIDCLLASDFVLLISVGEILQVAHYHQLLLSQIAGVTWLVDAMDHGAVLFPVCRTDKLTAQHAVFAALVQLLSAKLFRILLVRNVEMTGVLEMLALVGTHLIVYTRHSKKWDPGGVAHLFHAKGSLQLTQWDPGGCSFVHWEDPLTLEATCQDASINQQHCPCFNLEDKVDFNGGSIVMNEGLVWNEKLAMDDSANKSSITELGEHMGQLVSESLTQEVRRIKREKKSNKWYGSDWAV